MGTQLNLCTLIIQVIIIELNNMKKTIYRILLALILAASCSIPFRGKSQTWTEISNILNSKTAYLGAFPVTSNNSNFINLNLQTGVGYRAISFSLTGTWVATVKAQGSNDLSNWSDLYVATSNNPNTAWINSITANGDYTFLVTGYRYVRVRTTAYTSGTISSQFVALLGTITLAPSAAGGGSGLTDAQLRATPVPVSLSGHDSTTDSRIGVKLLQNPTIAGFASTPTVNIGTTGTIPVSIASVPSHPVTNAGTFQVQVDSSTQRISHKISQLPGTVEANLQNIDLITDASYITLTNIETFTDSIEKSVDNIELNTDAIKVSSASTASTLALKTDSTQPTINGYAIYGKVRNTIPSLTVGRNSHAYMSPNGSLLVQLTDASGNFLNSSTETTLSALEAKVPTGLTTNSNRLAVYSPDSIRVFATNGFGSGGGGGGGGTEYAEATTTSPATGTGALHRYNATPPTLTDGGMYLPQLDVNGSGRVVNGNKIVTGNITTQNLVPAGVATANSTVEIDMNGFNAVAVQVKGTYTGALTAQGTINGTTWVSLTNSVFWNSAGAGQGTNTIGSAVQGVFRVVNVPFMKFRISANAAVTGTATVSIITVPTGSILTGTDQSLLVTINGVPNATFSQSEDGAATNGALGNYSIGVRADTLTAGATTLTSANGDYIQSSHTNHGSKLVKDEERHKKTYRVTAIVAPSTLATDILTLAGANGVKTSVTKIIVTATQTTASLIDVYCLTRRTSNTGGTSTAEPRTRLDGNESGALSTCLNYTANPTVGTLDGNIEIIPMYINTTVATPTTYTFDFGGKGKPIVLNSLTQSVSINLNGVTVTGGRFYITIEFTEEF